MQFVEFRDICNVTPPFFFFSSTVDPLSRPCPCLLRFLLITHLYRRRRWNCPVGKSLSMRAVTMKTRKGAELMAKEHSVYITVLLPF